MRRVRAGENVVAGRSGAAYARGVRERKFLSFAGDLSVAFGALGPAGWRDFAYLAIAGSTLAPVFQVHAQQTLPAGRIALLFALEPVFALVFALTLGGERFVFRWWIGAALILSAVVMVEWRAARGGERG